MALKKIKERKLTQIQLDFFKNLRINEQEKEQVMYVWKIGPRNFIPKSKSSSLIVIKLEFITILLLGIHTLFPNELLKYCIYGILILLYGLKLGFLSSLKIQLLRDHLFAYSPVILSIYQRPRILKLIKDIVLDVFIVSCCYMSGLKISFAIAVFMTMGCWLLIFDIRRTTYRIINGIPFFR